MQICLARGFGPCLDRRLGYPLYGFRLIFREVLEELLVVDRFSVDASGVAVAFLVSLVCGGGARLRRDPCCGGTRL